MMKKQKEIKKTNSKKETRLNTTRLMNCGKYATIINYKNANDITVQFDDGVVVSHRTYRSFLGKNISHPNINKPKKKEESQHIQEVQYTKSGIQAKILRHNNGNKVLIQFEDRTSMLIPYSDFKNKIFSHSTFVLQNNSIEPKKHSYFGSFNIIEFSYQLQKPKDVFFLCQCKLCKKKDILNPKQMLEHVCENID